MEDIILNYAKKIASSKNIQKTIEELAGLYEKNGILMMHYFFTTDTYKKQI